MGWGGGGGGILFCFCFSRKWAAQARMGNVGPEWVVWVGFGVDFQHAGKSGQMSWKCLPHFGRPSCSRSVIIISCGRSQSSLQDLVAGSSEGGNNNTLWIILGGVGCQTSW